MQSPGREEGLTEPAGWKQRHVTNDDSGQAAQEVHVCSCCPMTSDVADSECTCLGEGEGLKGTGFSRQGWRGQTTTRKQSASLKPSQKRGEVIRGPVPQEGGGSGDMLTVEDPTRGQAEFRKYLWGPWEETTGGVMSCEFLKGRMCRKAKEHRQKGNQGRDPVSALVAASLEWSGDKEEQGMEDPEARVSWREEEQVDSGEVGGGHGAGEDEAKRVGPDDGIGGPVNDWGQPHRQREPVHQTCGISHS
ncbi:hypothetical protein NDU88_006570 [Pleurodeles waltl]|uniref:Uncharacterized protein n=1 Tax=Pleurodeles waltl TaxID=8319 RepID=A0AAV7TY07_PLEWA|nr:hypothetical protein NDU88_006570 [Pleurodeles waltl]